MMGDSDAAGASTRRRRATSAAGRGASLQPMNGRSAAVCESSVTADINRDNGLKKRDHSLETVRSQTKREKKKRRNDLGEGLR